MTAAEHDTADSDENPDLSQHVEPDVAEATAQAHENSSSNAHICRGAAADIKQNLQEDALKTGKRPKDAYNIDEKADESQSENMVDKQQNFDVPSTLSNVGDVGQAVDLLHVDTRPSVNQGVLNILDELTQQLRDDISDLQGELDADDGAYQPSNLISQLQAKLSLLDTVQHSEEKLSNDGREVDASLLALSDAVWVAQHAHCDSRSNLSPMHQIGAARESASQASQADVSKAVMDLVGAAQHLQEDPSNMESINNLIGRLKDLLLQERQTYAFMRQNSMSRNKLESLHKLIHYLESQVQRLQKASQRRGLRYYMASIFNKVRGDEVGRIGQSMESELQSWLDQQSVREISNVISRGSQDAQVHAICSFKSVIQRGYDPVLQETILSTELVGKLAGLLAPGAASWQLAQEAAFALSTLIDFNKDIFVSLILMARTVEYIIRLMNRETDEHVLILVSVIKSMLSAGHTIVVGEIFANNGVSKFVQLLDHELHDLQHAAMDCLFEMAYYGNIEIVNKMFELEVVKKLALLQQSRALEGEPESMHYDKPAKKEQTNPLDMATSWILPMTLMWMQDSDGTEGNPFANAVVKFVLHLSIGTGLRKSEKRALKQEFLRQIKEVMEDEAEIANITAEVLWSP